MTAVFDSDLQTVQQLRTVSSEVAAHISAAADRSAALQSGGSKLETLFFDQKPTQVWYLLEVAYSLLMPAHAPVMEDIWDFQVSRKVARNNFSDVYLVVFAVLDWCSVMLCLHIS